LLDRFFNRLFRSFFRFANRAAEFRETYPAWFKVILAIIISPLVIYLVISLTKVLGIDQFQDPPWWPLPYWGSSAVVTKVILSIILSTILIEVLGRGIFPFLFYGPQALAMRSVGLWYVTEDPEESWQIIQKGMKQHDSNQTIRVICISGRHLFREESMNLPSRARKSPLHTAASGGNLEVIMPKSELSNQTITSRYATYSPTYKRENNILTVDAFIDEINLGKAFLRNNGNTVQEHNILCMWRVIIFSKMCIVQNYFPNPRGEHSFLAPIMVFRKPDKPTPWIQYYDTFCEMFRLVKDGCD
jgi:hypothetical protein